MREILTKPSSIKLMKKLAKMQHGCRVCAYINASKSYAGKVGLDEAQEIMLISEDPLYKSNS